MVFYFHVQIFPKTQVLARRRRQLEPVSRYRSTRRCLEDKLPEGPAKESPRSRSNSGLQIFIIDGEELLMATILQRNFTAELSIGDVDFVPVTTLWGTNIHGGVVTTFKIVCPDQSTLDLRLVVRDIRFVPIVQRLLVGPLSRSEAAVLVRTSCSRFSHQFRRIFGMPFRTARVAIRLNLCKSVSSRDRRTYLRYCVLAWLWRAQKI